MSAFEVGKAHIDAMLTAGLVLPGQYGPLRWFHPRITPDDLMEYRASQVGEPWGPGAHTLTQLREKRLDADTASTVGAMLMAENRRSLDHRYAEEEWEQPYLFDRLRIAGTIDPVRVLKAINCYEYQSCEHPEWHDSQALVFCDALAGVCVRALPGYDEAPGWDVRTREFFCGGD